MYTYVRKVVFKGNLILMEYLPATQESCHGDYTLFEKIISFMEIYGS